MRKFIILAPLALTACATFSTYGPPGARLTNSDGVQIGTVRAWNSPGGVTIEVLAAGLTPGPHGIHVHATGRCDRPFFTTAGGHWNPTGRQHGHANPAGPHLGDGGNLIVGPDGRGRAMLMLPGTTLQALHDFDGAALVVHAKVDDERTDPSGNSGDRIACAIVP
jgi:Cu-Zn family superoxide dismutase